MMMISRMPMLTSLLRYPNDRCDKLVAKVIENRRVGYYFGFRPLNMTLCRRPVSTSKPSGQGLIEHRLLKAVNKEIAAMQLTL